MTFEGRLLRAVFVALVALLGFEVFSLKSNPPNLYAKKLAQWTERFNLNESVLIHTSGFSYFPSIFYHQEKYEEYLQSGGPHVRHPITEVRLQHLLKRGKTAFVLSAGTNAELFDDGTGFHLTLQERKTFSGRTFSLFRIHQKNN